MAILHTRFLEPADIPVLLELERSKWEPNQAADDETLLQRILAHPKLCMGSFCPRSGRALASLFLCPVVPAMFTAPTRWERAAMVETFDRVESTDSRSLFGISLSSNNAKAVKALFKFLYPHVLKEGWRDIYLGSPIPGFRQALAENPDLTVWRYVHANKRSGRGVPLDPQLRYYFKKGFKHIVSIQENYFPHEASMNYGVILRLPIPLSKPRSLWKIMPFFILESISTLVV